MSSRALLVEQFHRPSGLLGRLAGTVMAHRRSNVARNLWTIEQLPLGPSSRVLEIGFGPGIAMAALIERAPDAEVVGVDHSATMVAAAGRRNAAAIGRGRVHLHHADVTALDELPGRFDAAYGVNVCQFWSEPKAVLGDLHELLRPGGVVALTFQPRSPGATADDTDIMAEQLTEAMASVGFVDLERSLLALEPPAVCVRGVRP